MTETKNIHERFYDAYHGIRNPELDGVNPYFNNSKFSTLSAVLKVVNETCKANQLLYIQRLNLGSLTSFIYDKEGNDIQLSTISVPENTDPQKLGSFITYARRYQALTDWGIVGEEDDDGNAASDDVKKREAILKKLNKLIDTSTSLGIGKEEVNNFATVSYGRDISLLTNHELIELGTWLKGEIDSRTA